MNYILAVVLLLGVTGCSFMGSWAQQPTRTMKYISNISPAGEHGILVEKCKVKFNNEISQASGADCDTHYVWLGSNSEI